MLINISQHAQQYRQLTLVQRVIRAKHSDGSIKHGLRFVQPAFGQQKTSDFSKRADCVRIRLPGFVECLTEIVFSLAKLSGISRTRSGFQQILKRNVLGRGNLNEKKNQNRTA
jgi:hypothetical protein